MEARGHSQFCSLSHEDSNSTARSSACSVVRVAGNPRCSGSSATLLHANGTRVTVDLLDHDSDRYLCCVPQTAADHASFLATAVRIVLILAVRERLVNAP